MINVLGLCRMLREVYPIPAAPALIKQSILNHLGFEPPEDIRMDIVKVLVAKWKRDGWVWDIAGAVKLEGDEEALFHSSGLSLIKSAGISNPNNLLINPINFGDNHPRVVWFNDFHETRKAV